ncbi:MAG: hypothetical protein CL521_04955 [Actinobacteria bacterium]|nr:hypothetical protein [Actinomycetota bacterium]
MGFKKIVSSVSKKSVDKNESYIRFYIEVIVKLDQILGPYSDVTSGNALVPLVQNYKESYYFWKILVQMPRANLISDNDKKDDSIISFFLEELQRAINLHFSEDQNKELYSTPEIRIQVEFFMRNIFESWLKNIYKPKEIIEFLNDEEFRSFRDKIREHTKNSIARPDALTWRDYLKRSFNHGMIFFHAMYRSGPSLRLINLFQDLNELDPEPDLSNSAKSLFLWHSANQMTKMAGVVQRYAYPYVVLDGKIIVASGALSPLLQKFSKSFTPKMSPTKTVLPYANFDVVKGAHWNEEKHAMHLLFGIGSSKSVFDKFHVREVLLEIYKSNNSDDSGIKKKGEGAPDSGDTKINPGLNIGKRIAEESSQLLQSLLARDKRKVRFCQEIDLVVKHFDGSMMTKESETMLRLSLALNGVTTLYARDQENTFKDKYGLDVQEQELKRMLKLDSKGAFHEIFNKVFVDKSLKSDVGKEIVTYIANSAEKRRWAQVTLLPVMTHLVRCWSIFKLLFDMEKILKDNSNENSADNAVNCLFAFCDQGSLKFRYSAKDSSIQDYTFVGQALKTLKDLYPDSFKSNLFQDASIIKAFNKKKDEYEWNNFKDGTKYLQKVFNRIDTYRCLPDALVPSKADKGNARDFFPQRIDSKEEAFLEEDSSVTFDKATKNKLSDLLDVFFFFVVGMFYSKNEPDNDMPSGDKVDVQKIAVYRNKVAAFKKDVLNEVLGKMMGDFFDGYEEDGCKQFRVFVLHVLFEKVIETGAVGPIASLTSRVAIQQLLIFFMGDANNLLARLEVKKGDASHMFKRLFFTKWFSKDSLLSRKSRKIIDFKSSEFNENFSDKKNYFALIQAFFIYFCQEFWNIEFELEEFEEKFNDFEAFLDKVKQVEQTDQDSKMVIQARVRLERLRLLIQEDLKITKGLEGPEKKDKVFKYRVALLSAIYDYLWLANKSDKNYDEDDARNSFIVGVLIELNLVFKAINDSKPIKEFVGLGNSDAMVHLDALLRESLCHAPPLIGQLHGVTRDVNDTLLEGCLRREGDLLNKSIKLKYCIADLLVQHQVLISLGSDQYSFADHLSRSELVLVFQHFNDYAYLSKDDEEYKRLEAFFNEKLKSDKKELDLNGYIDVLKKEIDVDAPIWDHLIKKKVIYGGDRLTARLKAPFITGSRMDIQKRLSFLGKYSNLVSELVLQHRSGQRVRFYKGEDAVISFGAQVEVNPTGTRRLGKEVPVDEFYPQRWIDSLRWGLPRHTIDPNSKLFMFSAGSGSCPAGPKLFWPKLLAEAGYFLEPLVKPLYDKIGLPILCISSNEKFMNPIRIRSLVFQNRDTKDSSQGKLEGDVSSKEHKSKESKRDSGDLSGTPCSERQDTKMKTRHSFHDFQVLSRDKAPNYRKKEPAKSRQKPKSSIEAKFRQKDKVSEDKDARGVFNYNTKYNGLTSNFNFGSVEFSVLAAFAFAFAAAAAVATVTEEK